MIASEVRGGRWADSARLMAAARAAEAEAGVDRAACFMATPANLDQARELGLYDEAMSGAGPDDLVIAVSGPEPDAGLAAAPRAPGDAAGALTLPMLLAGLFFAGDLAFWHLTIVFTSVANATLLANLAPIFVTVGAWAVFGQRVTRTFLAGMTTALAGAFVLVGPSFGLGERHLLGDALGVVTAAFYGAYILAVTHLREARSTARIMAVSTTVCAAALLPFAVASGETMLPVTAAGWLVLCGLALVCQTAGQGLIAYAMAHLPASFSSVSLLLQPVMATLYAWVILGERAGPAQFAGGAVILAGIWLARRGR